MDKIATIPTLLTTIPFRPAPPQAKTCYIQQASPTVSSPIAIITPMMSTSIPSIDLLGHSPMSPPIQIMTESSPLRTSNLQKQCRSSRSRRLLRRRSPLVTVAAYSLTEITKSRVFNLGSFFLICEFRIHTGVQDN